MRIAAVLGAMILVAGCAGGAERPEPVALAADWRTTATPADRARLRGWRRAWVVALAEARGAEHGAAITAGGTLFDPDAALDGAMPPAGSYRCRVVKLGTQGGGTLAYIAYPFFDCRVGEGAFAKLTGSQRPVGRLFPDTAARAIFLGTLVLGDEAGPMTYGRDANRDVAGLVERVGERRWRMVLPYPRFESILDVVELVPGA